MNKNRLKNKLKIGILFLCISFLFTNCQTENLTTELEQEQSFLNVPSIAEAKSNFTSKNENVNFYFNHGHNRQQKTSKSTTSNFSIDWEKSIIKEFDENIDFLYTPVSKTINSRTKTIVASILNENVLESYSFTLVYDNDYNHSQFSGFIFKHDIHGNFVSAYKYNAGEKVNTYVLEQSSNSSVSAKSNSRGCSCSTSIFEIAWSIANGVSGDNILACVCISSSGGFGSSSSTYDDWSTPSSNLKNPISSGGLGLGSNTSSGGSGSFGGSGTSYNDGENNIPYQGEELQPWWSEDDDKIDDTELTGKEKCLHDLLDKNGNSYIKDLMSKFKGESEFDIKIVSKDKVTVIDDNGDIKEVNGTTSPIINDVITINISTSKANSRSGLDVARTILHEYIHADIRRKMKTISPSDSDKEFRDVFEQYGNEHHEVMGDLYVNSMRDAMKHFHKNVLTDDYNKYTTYYEEKPSDAFYEALAWRGLKEHDVKAWTDLSSTKKQELESLSLRVDVLTRAVTCPE